MTLNDCIHRHKYLTELVTAKNSQCKELRAIAESMSPSSGFGASGQISDKVGKTVAKIVDLEREILSDIDDLIELKQTIYRGIKAIDNPLYELVLERKILLGESLESIAEKINYSVAQVKRIYGVAKEKLKKMIPNEPK